MQTASLNRKQSRALSLVQPGTVIFSGSIMGMPVFITEADDRYRSGIEAITLGPNGDVILDLSGGVVRTVKYADLIAREREAMLEEQAENGYDDLDAAVRAADSLSHAALAEAARNSQGL